jgi:hypothetical protein
MRPFRSLAFAALLLLGAAPAPSEAQTAAPGAAGLGLSVLAAAREIDLDMSRSEAVEVLRAAGLSVEQEADLPPDGLTRLIVAVPADDDCLPRGAPLTCANIRVHLLNDPQRGHRVVRVEAFQPLEQRVTVAEVFRQVGAALGPPLQTTTWPEQVRGGSVSVWRQRWRDGMSEGPLTEILATQPNEDPVTGATALANPHEPASGVGYVRADLDAESAFASVRRRLLTPAPGR